MENEKQSKDPLLQKKSASKQRIPKRIACDKQYICYLINELNISNKSKAHLLHYLLYASSKCRHAKMFYYSFTSCTIMLPILVTLQNTCETLQAKCVSSILVAATSITAALLSLFKFHEKWTRYRNYIENALANIIDAVYAFDKTTDGNEPEEPSEPPRNKNTSNKEVISELERQIMIDFNKLNREHQNLWAQERRHDQVESNKN